MFGKTDVLTTQQIKVEGIILQEQYYTFSDKSFQEVNSLIPDKNKSAVYGITANSPSIRKKLLKLKTCKEGDLIKEEYPNSD